MMQSFSRYARRVTAVVALLAAAAPLTAQDLPAASELIERYVEAMGGRDAILGHQNSRATGSFSMPAAGISGELEVVADEGRVLERVEIGGLGTSFSGYDGEVGWSVDPNIGPRLLEGKELQALVESTQVENTLRGEEMFEVRETVELTEMNGQACYKVRLVSKSGRETIDCYSTETGLRVAMISTQDTPMGAIEMTTLFDEYGDFDGMRVPTRMTQQLFGVEQVLIIESVEFGVAEDDDFVPPEVIRTLIEQQGG
jgi:hypothetical protein